MNAGTHPHPATTNRRRTLSFWLAGRRRTGRDQPVPHDTPAGHDDERIPADAVVVLTLAHSDNSVTYYGVPRSWAVWATKPFSAPPVDLVEMRRKQYGPDVGPVTEFEHRTRQALACDDHHLGGSLADVIAAVGSDADRLIELNGTSY